METKKTAVIYARQSFGAEENSLSCELQINACRAWAERNNVEIIGEFTDTNTSSELYPDSDEGRAYAATDREWRRWASKQQTKGRRKYRKGLALAFEQLSKIDYFIVNESTRFYRNPHPLATLDTYCLGTLKENGVALVEAESGKIDPINNNIDLAVRRLLATYEMEKLTERHNNSMKSRKELLKRGFVFSNAYAVEWIDKKVCFHAEKAKVVKFVFDSIINGKTVGGTLSAINTQFLALADGQCFYETSIYNIIANPIYCGIKIKDGEIIKAKNIVNPIISFDEWKTANQIIADRKARGGRQSRKEKYNFLPLSGLLFCGNCGKKLTVGKDNGVIYYCRHRYLKKQIGCGKGRLRTFIDTDDNDLYLALQPLLMISLFTWYAEIKSRQTKSVSVENLQVELLNVESKINKLVSAFTANGIADDIFDQQIKLLADRKKAIKQEILQNENQNAEADDRLIAWLNEMFGKIKSDTYHELIGEDEFSTLIRKTINKITVYPTELKVELYDGNTFTIQRKLVDKRGRTIIDYGTVENYFDNGIVKPTVKFGDGEKILETDFYKIMY
ncbi:MAG: recombinase family protein [Lentisphaerae bacterium]|nr:recombinase family protein [Lentisphaerota bacterium]